MIGYHIYTTTRCNLGCVYCHEKFRVNKPPYLKFDEQRIETLYRSILKHHRSIKDYKINFLWTGGEPLTIPLEKMKRFIALQKKIFPKRYRIHNSIQTNLLTISDKYIHWLRRHKKSIGLGVSLDFNEHTRLTTRGAPSQGRVFKNLQRLSIANIPFEILCVVSKYNVDRMEDIYNYAVENEVDFHFIVLEQSLKLSTRRLIVSPRIYAEHLLALIKKYALDTKTTIRFLNAVAYSSLVLKNSVVKGYCEIIGGNCGRDFICVIPDGKVFACSSLAFDEYCLGNIFDQGLKEILSSSNRAIMKFRNRSLALSNGVCSSCKWKTICKGGCPNDPIVKGNLHKKNMYRCAMNKYLFKELTKFYRDLGYETRFK
jgi:uncharacterized protein